MNIRVVENRTLAARGRYAGLKDTHAYEFIFDNWLTELDIQKHSPGPNNAFAYIADF